MIVVGLTKFDWIDVLPIGKETYTLYCKFGQEPVAKWWVITDSVRERIIIIFLNKHGFRLPSKYSSLHSWIDAAVSLHCWRSLFSSG